MRIFTAKRPAHFGRLAYRGSSPSKVRPISRDSPIADLHRERPPSFRRARLSQISTLNDAPHFGTRAYRRSAPRTVRPVSGRSPNADLPRQRSVPFQDSRLSQISLVNGPPHFARLAHCRSTSSTNPAISPDVPICRSPSSKVRPVSGRPPIADLHRQRSAPFRETRLSRISLANRPRHFGTRA